MKNRNVRSVVKGLSWRAFAAIDTAIAASVVMFYRTGHFELSQVIGLVGGIVGMELVTKTFLFAFHERLWEREPIQVEREERVEPRPTWDAVSDQMCRDFHGSRFQEAIE